MSHATQSGTVKWMLAPVMIGYAVALLAGLAIAWVDSRPNWDDTGVTAAAILGVSGFACLIGVSPWLAPLLVAGPVVAAEIARGPGVLLAVVVALVGSVVGAVVRRLFSAA